MKVDSMRISIGVVVWLVVSGFAISATQDKYSVSVPGGLGFSEFRGYESWPVISVSHNGNKLAATLGNPVMIDAYHEEEVRGDHAAADPERRVHELHLGFELRHGQPTKHRHRGRVDHADRRRLRLRGGHAGCKEKRERRES